jgi:hypothetical protein
VHPVKQADPSEPEKAKPLGVMIMVAVTPAAALIALTLLAFALGAVTCAGLAILILKPDKRPRRAR